MRFGEWINEMKKDYFEKYRLLGLNISYYRKRARLSQIKMAELLDISRTHMSRIETEECAVSLDVIFRLCEVLQIPPKSIASHSFHERAGMQCFFSFWVLQLCTR